MHRSPGARKLALLAPAVCLVLASATPAAHAAAAAAVTYQHESEPAFEQQLASGQVRAATINKPLRSVRLTLADGTHYVVRYPAHQRNRVIAQLKAKGVAVSVLGKAQAEAEEKKVPVHHKLRYIAGGILLVVIIVVAGVLLVNRRRQLHD